MTEYGLLEVKSAVLLSKGRLFRFQNNPVGPPAVEIFFRHSGSENYIILSTALSYNEGQNFSSILSCFRR